MNANALKLCPQCGTEYPASARFCEIDGTALRIEGTTDLVGSIIADRYHVMRKLGEGGMGQVYLAEHVKMGRKSALKVMHPGAVKDVDAISRFNREAANASRISHANVAAVYDFGETPDGIIYLAMEFVDGPPLTKVIEELGALPPKRAAEIARQTAEALTVAHDMGIVHRDLKPDNIMLGKTRDGGDLVKVVDFGIAKAAGNTAQKVTKTGLVVGTPDYMSPEQLAGDPVDGRSDIYALGLVTFNMLTGTLPFPSDSAQESMIMRLTDKPKTLSEMRPEVRWPTELQAVLDKALARDAALRYRSAIEFARELTKAVEPMVSTSASAGIGTGDVVPETRVAPAMLTPKSAATVPVPSVVARPAAGGLPPMPAARPRRRPMIPIGGGIIGLLVISAALYGPILKLNRKSQVAAADTTPSAPPFQPPRDTTQQPAARSTIAAGASTPAIDVDKELSTADSLSKRDDLASARSALQRIKALEGHLDAAGDAARAALITFEAYVTLDDTEKACAALRDVKDRARGTSYQRKVDDRLVACP